MFGAIAVMVDDSMVVAVNKDRSLLVRVDPADDEELSRRSEASRAEMAQAGRWVRVGCGSVSTRSRRMTPSTSGFRRRSCVSSARLRPKDRADLTAGVGRPLDRRGAPPLVPPRLAPAPGARRTRRARRTAGCRSRGSAGTRWIHSSSSRPSLKHCMAMSPPATPTGLSPATAWACRIALSTPSVTNVNGASRSRHSWAPRGSR